MGAVAEYLARIKYKKKVLIKQSGGLWYIIDEDHNIKKLPKKLKTTLITRYQNSRTGEKSQVKVVPEKPFFGTCRECHKTAVPAEFWCVALEKASKGPDFGYFNSEGEFVHTDVKMVDKDWIWTNKKFPHHNFCSDECYKKYKIRKRKARQDKNRMEKYRNLPVDERPDGFCKVCDKDISDKRAGVLTCCPAHRQEYKRRRDKLKRLLPASS